MKARNLIFAGLFLCAAAGFAQTIDSSIHVNQFPGSTVGAKVTNAMATCTTNVQVPCILVVDPSLAPMTTGTLPSMCSHCYLVDYRTGPPVSAGCGSSSPCTVTQGGSGANNAFGGLKNLNGINPLALSDQTNHPYDDFDAPDGTPLNGHASRSGFVWSVAGGGAADAVINGRSWGTTDNSYATLQDTQTVTEVGGSFSWTPTSGATLGNSITLIESSTGSIATGSLIHLEVTSTGYNLDIRTGTSGSIVPIATCAQGNGFGNSVFSPNHLFLVQPLLDGTPYTVWMQTDWAAGTVTLHLPDGTTVDCSDPSIPSMDVATAGIWQITAPVAGYAPVNWDSAWIGPSKADKLTAQSPSQSLYQNRFSGHKSFITFSPTAEGSYLIATDDGEFPNHSMGGKVAIYGVDVGGRTAQFELNIGLENNASSSLTSAGVNFSAAPYLGEWAGGMIDTATVSTDNSTGVSQLCIDVNTPNYAGSSVTAIFDGNFTPVASPVVGCSSLPDAVVTIPVAFAPILQYTAAGTTSGNAVFSEPVDTPFYKVVVVNLNALDGTAVVNFPEAFTAIPDYFVGASLSGVSIFPLTMTAAVIAAASATTGVITIIGY